MSQTEIPDYVSDASFIELSRSIDPDWWYRDPAYYSNTRNWEQRVESLMGAIHPSHADAVIEHGNLFPAANGNVAFVTDERGVATYAVVAAELTKHSGVYPTDPDKSDYSHKKVTFWAHVYDTEKALDSDVWSKSDLRVINSVC